MRVVGSIEARMGSSRLRGKTMMEVWDGRPLLDLVVSRFRLCREIAEVVVATTDQPGDDAIAAWCGQNGVTLYRGSENDVLDRVAGAAGAARADAIVQMGGDSAYLDYKLIDVLVSEFRLGQWDYVCNDLQLTFPLGIYGHVVAAGVLHDLNRHESLSAADRVDVVRHIWEHPDKYRIRNITAPPEYAYPNLRLTIDYPEDMALAKACYNHFNRHDFTTLDLIGLYGEQPELFEPTLNLKQHSAPFIKSVQ